MFRLLLKIRLKGLGSAMISRLGRNKKKTALAGVLMTLLILYALGAVGLSVGMMFHGLAEVAALAQLQWFYFALAGMMMLLLGFVGTVFMTQSQLYEAKDNELLLSMPIKPSAVLACRLAAIGVVELAYTMLIAVPVCVAYCLVMGFQPLTVLFFVLGSLLLTVLALTISCLCGWLVSLLTARIQRKNLLSVLLMLAFFGVYLYAYAQLPAYLEKLMANGTEMALAFKKALPALYYFGVACASGDWLRLLAVAAVCLVPFALLYWLLSRNFVRLATQRRTAPKSRLRGKLFTSSGPFKALVKKEMASVWGMPMYLFNCGLGALLAPVGAVFLAVKGRQLLQLLTLSVQNGEELTLGIHCLMPAVCMIMTLFSAPSLSLEGKSFGLLKGLPVKAKTVLNAKITAHLLLGGVPLAVALAVLGVAFELTAGQWALLLALPFSVLAFGAVFGMAANLLLPRFDWVNPTLMVKQSGSVMLAMFGGMFVLALPLMVYFVWLIPVIEITPFLWLCTAFFVVLTLALLRFVHTRGVRMYEKM